jgi:hypothetical protein
MRFITVLNKRFSGGFEREPGFPSKQPGATLPLPANKRSKIDLNTYLHQYSN